MGLLRLTRCQDSEPNWELEIVMWGSPASKTRTSKQLMRFPPGLKEEGRGWVEQAMKSTCLKHEEVRREDRKGQGGGVPLWPPKLQPAGGTCRVPACQTAVHGKTNSRGIRGILGGCSAYRCPTLAPEQGFSYIPALNILQRFHKRRRKADDVKGMVAQCNHWWQDPKIENQSSDSFRRQSWKFESITMKVSGDALLLWAARSLLSKH